MSALLEHNESRRMPAYLVKLGQCQYNFKVIESLVGVSECEMRGPSLVEVELECITMHLRCNAVVSNVHLKGEASPLYACSTSTESQPLLDSHSLHCPAPLPRRTALVRLPPSLC